MCTQYVADKPPHLNFSNFAIIKLVFWSSDKFNNKLEFSFLVEFLDHQTSQALTHVETNKGQLFLYKYLKNEYHLMGS